MTISASTPRLRLTQLLYLAVLVTVALSDRTTFTGSAGVAVIVAGAALVVLAVLGRLWTALFIAGRKDTDVVAEGPYAACRHPLYALSLLAGFGLGLASRSVILALLVPAALAVAFAAAITREERGLADRHGAKWQAYAAAVPRLWPDWRRLTWPARAEIDLATYRKAFIDAASFLALLLALLAVDALRALGLWSTLIRLP